MACPVSPVARTNVCPMYGEPKEPVMYAFSYSVPAKAGARGSFVLAGGGDRRSGAGTTPSRSCGAGRHFARGPA